MDEELWKKGKALKEMMVLAAREGFRVIPEEEYQEFVAWKRGKQNERLS